MNNKARCDDFASPVDSDKLIGVILVECIKTTAINIFQGPHSVGEVIDNQLTQLIDAGASILSVKVTLERD